MLSRCPGSPSRSPRNQVATMSALRLPFADEGGSSPYWIGSKSSGGEESAFDRFTDGEVSLTKDHLRCNVLKTSVFF